MVEENNSSLSTELGEAKQIANEDRVIRIVSKDIEGKMSLYAGLTKIKGISWALSGAICNLLKLDRKKKIGELSGAEIKRVEEVLSSPEIPGFLQNRRKDLAGGDNKHLIGADLDLQKEFDIKRIKKMKSYKGFRHVAGLPTRGQRTRSNFRKNRRKGAGIRKTI